jgi:O-antigen/teichoic acid export membrane protein
MILNTGFSKLLGFMAQVAMGWLISRDDFALFAIAISVSAFAGLLSDVGLRNLLIQRHSEYDALEGPIFWLSLLLNLSAALVLASLAPFIAGAYTEPTLLGILQVIALSSVLATPASVLSAKLRIDLRFKELSLIQIGSSCVRYGGMVGLAWSGFGPMSFVLPVVFVNCYEAIAMWALARSVPWHRPLGLERWRESLRETKWILLGSFSLGLLNNGLYLALGNLVPKAVVGIYFFAYQIVVQIGLLLSHNLFQVLFPAFSQLVHHPERNRAAIGRTLGVTMLVAALSFVVIPTFGSLEQLIWHGKWAETVQPVQILGVFFPITVLLSVVLAVQAAEGRYRASALMSLALALATICAGLAGGFVTKTANGIALYSGLTIFIGSLLYLAIALRIAKLPVRSLLQSVLIIWFIGAFSASLSGMISVVATSAWSSGLRLASEGLIFLVTFGAAVRICAPERLREFAEMVPPDLRVQLLNLLRLSPRSY